MRPVVALVTARPETIAEDYERLLDLAGLDWLPGAGAVPVAAAAASWDAGRSVPPWQLDAVLTRWTEAAVGAPPLMALAAGGGRAPAVDPAWAPALARHGGATVGPEAWETRSLRVAASLPALFRSLPEGFQVPEGVRERPVVLLDTVKLEAGWLVRGAVAALGALLAPRLRRNRRAHPDEVRAEIAGLAREVLPRTAAVLDGTLWSLARGSGARPVARGVLLAGSDPVAVDAVALRLAGLDPRRAPWLRLCEERGFGVADMAAIRLRGNTELLDLDFGIPAATFAGRPAAANGWRRRLAPWSARPADGPWADLYRAQRLTPESGVSG